MGLSPFFRQLFSQFTGNLKKSNIRITLEFRGGAEIKADNVIKNPSTPVCIQTRWTDVLYVSQSSAPNLDLDAEQQTNKSEVR